jgi:hypothetical protein
MVRQNSMATIKTRVENLEKRVVQKTTKSSLSCFSLGF